MKSLQEITGTERTQRPFDTIELSWLSRRRFIARLATGAASVCLADALRDLWSGERNLFAEAAELARSAVTVDLHCHPNKLAGGNARPFEASIPPDMRAGRVDAGVFAVRGDYGTIRRDGSRHRFAYREPKTGELFRKAQEQLDGVIAATKQGKIALALSPSEILAAKKIGLPSAVLAIEGSDPLEGEPSRVKFFFDRGVRVLQLVHYRINELGDIQTEQPKHKGITAVGREVVREMNRLGMIIDTAHCSSDTVAGVLSESRQPVIFSHTGAYALRKMSRNLSDGDLRAIAAKGGVIGIWPNLRRRDTLETLFKDIDYVKNLVGADHVGIGTDLFGLDDHTSVPTHKEFALIPAGLLKRGYLEGDVEKIVGGNFMRVFGVTSSS